MSTLSALQTAARRKVSLSLTSTDYSDANLNANMNEWYRMIMGWVIGATGIWEIQGEVALTSLVQDQIEYVLPTDLIFINRVEIKFSGSTNYVKADRLDDKETDSAFQNGTIDRGSTAAPFYRLFDNSLFIYPKPSAASSNGLAIEYVKDITDLSAAGDIPNLNPIVHRALAVGGAYEYCITSEMWQKARELERQLLGRPGGSGTESLKSQIENLAAQRDRSTRARIIPRRSSFR